MQEPSAFPAVKLHYPEQEQLKCPRCDSANTKFCYYNNYNLSQPRHFCKTCRRYWTKGGTLRNIPVGGTSRKNNKRSFDPKRSSSSTPPSLPAEPVGSAGNLDDKNKLKEGPTSMSLLMGSNGQFGNLLEGPSPSPSQSGPDVKMLRFDNGGGDVVGANLSSGLVSGSDKNTGNDNGSSIGGGYVGLQSGETSYWNGVNGWSELANYNPPRSSI